MHALPLPSTTSQSLRAYAPSWLDGAMAVPNTVTITFIVPFSQGTRHRPSRLVSQNAPAAVYMPAPFFCMMKHVTAGEGREGEGGGKRVTGWRCEAKSAFVCRRCSAYRQRSTGSTGWVLPFAYRSRYSPTYLKGRSRASRAFKQLPMTALVHTDTLDSSYSVSANVCCRDCRWRRRGEGKVRDM